MERLMLELYFLPKGNLVHILSEGLTERERDKRKSRFLTLASRPSWAVGPGRGSDAEAGAPHPSCHFLQDSLLSSAPNECLPGHADSY